MNYLGPILALGVLIIVHEAGHFFVARWCGMRVERFSIGFGPAIAKWRSKRGSLFQLAPIPFGGFVEIKGMNIAEDVDPDDKEAYPNAANISSTTPASTAAPASPTGPSTTRSPRSIPRPRPTASCSPGT